MADVLIERAGFLASLEGLLSEALDGFAPDWRSDDCVAIRDAVYLASSERRHAEENDAEDTRQTEKTLLAMCRLYDSARLQPLIQRSTP